MATINNTGLNRQDPSSPSRQQDTAGSLSSATFGGNSLPQQAVNQPLQQASLQDQSAAEPQELQETVTRLTDFVQSVQRNLSFSVDDITGETVILVTDRTTDEVIRQIPSEELLNLARNLNELQERREGDSLDDLGKGNLFDQIV